MKNTGTNTFLPTVQSFEEYEKLKVNLEIFETAAREIIQRHQLPNDLALKIFSDGTNIVFAYGDRWVIKICPPFHYDQYKAELLVLQHLQGKLSVKTPAIEFFGDISGWSYIVMTKLPGILLEGLWEEIEFSNKMIIMHELGSLIREVHALPTQGLEMVDSHWPEFISNQISSCKEKHRLTLSKFMLEQMPAYFAAVNDLLKINKAVLLTGEYTPMNILVTQVSGVWHITGLIDFGDAMLGLPEYDLLGPGAFLIQGDKQLLKEFLLSYGYSQDKLTPTLSHQLTALMLLHKYSNLNVQVRIKDWKSRINSLEDLEKLVWGV